ncbi:MAG: hypothetical protein ACSHWU_07980 [Marinicella sp.]
MEKHFTSSRMFKLTNTTFSLHFDYIITLAGIFLVLALSIGEAGEYLIQNYSFTGFISICFLFVVVYAKLMVMIHRLVILGEKRLGNMFKWTAVELKFIAWVLVAIGVAGGVLYFLIVSMDQSNAQASSGGFIVLLEILVFFAVGFLFSRLALIFPAAAAGHKLTLNESWNMSSNHKFILFLLVVLVPYFTGKIMELIPQEILIWSLIVEGIRTFVFTYEVCLLSHCYDALNQDEEDKFDSLSS